MIGLDLFSHFKAESYEQEISLYTNNSFTVINYTTVIYLEAIINFVMYTEYINILFTTSM